MLRPFSRNARMQCTHYTKNKMLCLHATAVFFTLLSSLFLRLPKLRLKEHAPFYARLSWEHVTEERKRVAREFSRNIGQQCWDYGGLSQVEDLFFGWTMRKGKKVESEPRIVPSFIERDAKV